MPCRRLSLRIRRAEFIECLLLQLVQGSSFTEPNIYPARGELPERLPICLLGAGTGQIRRAAGVVPSLNPIPPSGFNAGEDISHAEPGAFVNGQKGKLLLK